VLDKCIRCGGSGRTTNPTAPTDDFRIAVMEAEQRAPMSAGTPTVAEPSEG
jgi:hypothetical protein